MAETVLRIHHRDVPTRLGKTVPMRSGAPFLLRASDGSAPIARIPDDRALCWLRRAVTAEVRRVLVRADLETARAEIVNLTAKGDGSR
jgi:hypothetical protein